MDLDFSYGDEKMGRTALTPKKIVHRDIYRSILFRMVTENTVSNVDLIDLFEFNGNKKAGLISFYISNLKQFGLIEDLSNGKKKHREYTITEKGIRLLKNYHLELIVENTYKNL